MLGISIIMYSLQYGAVDFIIRYYLYRRTTYEDIFLWRESKDIIYYLVYNIIIWVMSTWVSYINMDEMCL